jgi:hypothetical protein
MQMRLATDLSADEYVRQKAWKDAKLNCCPLHPEGGCGFARHGTYRRKFPDGAKITRWYCAKGHTTFGLLPDCLSSRLSGSLIEVEAVIVEVENSPSQEAAADKLRPDTGFVGVLRWIRRRISLVRSTLIMLIELFPTLLADCQPTISSFRFALNVEYVLPELRAHAALYLHILPPPIGFGPRPEPKKCKKNHFQHKTGTDPPYKRM